MKKYTESVIINIIDKIEAVNIKQILEILLIENIDLTINQLYEFLQHLIDKKYIYRHNDNYGNIHFPILYSNSNYYFKNICDKLDNTIDIDDCQV